MVVRNFTYKEGGKNYAGAKPTDKFIAKLNDNTNALITEFKSYLEKIVFPFPLLYNIYNKN